MSVTYKLETFEGPLDLLLHLIDKAEIDIYNIPISEITEQYLAYLDTMTELELEVTSEFLVMAATLLAIKSKMLLPKPPVIEVDVEYEDPDYDPRMELVQKLLEYRKYKGAAEVLREKEVERSLIYTKEPMDLTPYVPVVQVNPVQGIHLADLVLAMQKVLRRSAQRNTVARIRRDEISVKERMIEMEAILQRERKTLFSKLFSSSWNRSEIVATFLALLELMKRKSVICYQYSLFDDIVIEYRGQGGSHELSTDEVDY